MTTSDYDAALHQAEILLSDADRARDLARLVRIGPAVFAFLIAVALVISAAVTGMPVVNLLIAILVCGAIVAIAVVLVETIFVQPLKRRIGRDERVMLDIIGPLREPLVSVARDESWSPSRQRLARARI